MCNITYPKFPCRICVKNVSDKDKADQCGLCELWVHIKCNNLNCLDHRYLQNSNEFRYCIEYCSTIFPFNSLSSNKNFLDCCTNTDNNSTHWHLIDLQHLLNCTKIFFDIIAISETRITKQVFLLNNLNLNNYSFEFTPTETSAGGILFYIANHLSYKCRDGLNIYKKNELESTFIETVNPKKVGVIYRHPSMDLTDFNCNYLNQLLENISKEKNLFSYLKILILTS